MNTARKLLTFVPLLLLVACASTGTASNHALPSGATEDDAVYVATVEELADRNITRVRVIWVNPPGGVVVHP